jgi:hypothetical protein
LSCFRDDPAAQQQLPEGRGSRKVLRIRAARRILPGDEIYNGYIDFGRVDSAAALTTWGFTTPRM